jgi:hypothetical protein
MEQRFTQGRLRTARALLLFLLQMHETSNSRPERISSGIFGLARGQIARINAVHVGDPNIKPIELTISFVNASGATVAHDTKTVQPGKAIYFDFEFDASLQETRQELRALIGAKGPANPDKHLKISIEVFDGDTGKGTVYYGDKEI